MTGLHLVPSAVLWQVLSAFGSVPNLSLAVEHGFQFRLRDGSWQQPVRVWAGQWVLLFTSDAPNNMRR